MPERASGDVHSEDGSPVRRSLHAGRRGINPARKHRSILSLCAGAEGMQDAARRTDEQSEAPEFVNP